MSGRIPSEEEFDAAKSAVEKVGKIIEEDEKRESSKPLVQEFPPDPVGNLEAKVRELQEENEELRKTIKELKKDLDEKVSKVEEDVEDLGNIIEQENSKQ